MTDYMEIFKQGLCTPVVIVLVLTALNVLMGLMNKSQHPAVAPKGTMGQRVMGSLLLIGLLWGLCYYGYVGAAWFFLLLPFILVFLEIAMVMGAMSAMTNGESS